MNEDDSDHFSVNEDWSVLKFLQWLGSFLGAAAPYDFKLQNVYAQLYGYYSALLIMVTLFGSIYSFVGRNIYVYDIMNLTTITMDTLSAFASTIFNLVVIISSLLTSKTVEVLLTSLLKNDMFLSAKCKSKKRNSNKVKFQFSFVSINVFFVIIVIYDIYVWLKFSKILELKYYVFKYFQYYIYIYVAFHFCEYLKLIMTKMSFSMKVFLNLIDEMHKFPRDCDESSKEINGKWLRVSQRVKPRDEDVMQLNLLIKIFDVLINSVDKINTVFEYPILFFVLSTVVEIFQALNYAIACGSKSLINEDLATLEFILLRVCWCLLLLILTIFLTKTSVCLECRMKKLTNTLYKKLLDTPSATLLRDEAQESLILVHQQFIEKRFQISGVFFKLNNNLLLDTFIVITSSIPVIIQFNRIENN
ncbi:hypothetical protein FQR65_LT04088 [Abscondita terminalis]|nr:hypothetical protein FQR65_LT04088 [Abscondita terminalis]